MNDTDDIDTRRSPLGIVLKAMRDERGVSQQRLARLTNGAVTDSHIAQIEVGARGASRDKLDAIAGALKLNKVERSKLLGASAEPADELQRPARLADVNAIREELAALASTVDAVVVALQRAGVPVGEAPSVDDRPSR